MTASLTRELAATASARRLDIRRIELADLREVLAKGFDDFSAMPTFAFFLIAIYPIVGLVLLRLTFGYDLLPLVFPLVAGFPLVGPLAAIGLYDLSRRREQGLEISLDAISDFSFSGIRDILGVGLVLMTIFLLWLGAALAVYQLCFGSWVPLSVGEFLGRIFTTPEGWMLIVLGCSVGFFFAVVAFSLSVVSIPLLLDRDVGVPMALSTSVRAVLMNPVTMALWGLTVAIALLIGCLPFFFGLAIVLPLLGHSTWHLYRKVVGPKEELPLTTMRP